MTLRTIDEEINPMPEKFQFVFGRTWCLMVHLNPMPPTTTCTIVMKNGRGPSKSMILSVCSIKNTSPIWKNSFTKCLQVLRGVISYTPSLLLADITASDQYGSQ